ncbi:E3 ubiquitin-protein ligase ATL31-like [Dioscorea cayenensis subsp. rotundata]|uniref:RING-type E3 ubiquitin transferase n=1 Tax=Dioscorea cayennensis subsp. rotundata TaxID=55577 RepID=A0AB40CW78_DIOCR|nr:E3 ubiquitin-protein ligase ATL31-like [Dioscorea cayenensis subsp. rotundata]
MMTNPSRPIPMRLLLLLILAAGAAGQTNTSDTTRYTTTFNPTMAIIIVVLISAFFFLGFFSIYIRQCGGGGGLGSNAGVNPVTGALSRRGNAQRGLDPEVLFTFPTFVYSEVKDHKIGKGSLECAVCLSEFEDDESLRLLPKCDHVFHSDCIDAWLAAHVTCPVCRSNLVPGSDPEPIEAPAIVTAAPDEPPEHVAIAVDGDGDQETDDHREELAELARIGSEQRAAQALRSKSVARPVRFPRSHSTGHSILRRPGENLDRFTLRLPEHVRREMVVAGLQRTTSSLAFPGGGEASARRGYRAGEGSSRAGRSIRLGRSDRWPSVLARTLSARFTSWGNGKRGGDGEGSVKKFDGVGEGSRSGSVKLRMPSVRVPFECLGGSVRPGGDHEPSESPTQPLSRV